MFGTTLNTTDLNNTLHPVYSELCYSEYPLIVNGSLRTNS